MMYLSTLVILQVENEALVLPRGYKTGHGLYHSRGQACDEKGRFGRRLDGKELVPYETRAQ